MTAGVRSVSQPELEQDQLPQLGGIAIQALRKPLQPLRDAAAVHIAKLDHAHLSRPFEKLGSQGNQGLAVDVFVRGFRPSFQDRRRKDSRERAAHQAPRLARPANHSRWNGHHKLDQGTMGKGVGVRDML